MIIYFPVPQFRLLRLTAMDLSPSYFYKMTLYIMLLLFAASFFFYRKLNKFLFYLNLLVFIGVTAYILLFYQAFNVHDYYLINLLVLVPLPFITMIEMLKRNYPALLNSSILKISFVLILLFLTYRTAVITRMKYSANDWFVRTNFVISRDETDHWRWFHSDYEKHLKSFETITPYLRSLGINRTDRVLSLSDFSVNISLYFMDQKGYTAFGYNNTPLDQKMDIYKKNGIKYLIIDNALNEEAYLKPYLKYKTGEYKNISIFKFDW